MTKTYWIRITSLDNLPVNIFSLVFIYFKAYTNYCEVH